MDGAKQGHYMRSETNATIYYGEIMYKCIDAESGKGRLNMEKIIIKGRGAVKGIIKGEALVCPESIKVGLG